MAKAEDAFDPVLADIAAVARQPQVDPGPQLAVHPEGGHQEVPSFKDTYVRHEFHPLISGVLWVVDRVTEKGRSAG